MGRPRTDPDVVATPTRILAAAAEAFATHGVAGATLAQIARAAGIRRPSLLYHYNSKDLLYRAVVRDVFDRLEAVLDGPMGDDAAFEVRLEALVRAYAAFLAAHPHHARIVVREMIAEDSPGTAILREHIAPILARVVAFLQVAGADRLRPQVPLSAAVMQIASDVLLQNAAGDLATALWGESSPDRTWHLARALLLRTDPS